MRLQWTHFIKFSDKTILAFTGSIFYLNLIQYPFRFFTLGERSCYLDIGFRHTPALPYGRVHEGQVFTGTTDFNIVYIYVKYCIYIMLLCFNNILLYLFLRRATW